MSLTSANVKSFSEAYNDFDISQAKRLGAGGFGKVYLIAKRDSGELYAAKYQKLNNKSMQTLVYRETEYLRDLEGGKGVVQIYDLYQKERHSLLVMEYLEGGDLFSRCGASDYELTEDKCQRFVYEIVSGLNYIHSKDIIHLDIKPQNIMLTSRKKDTHLKLIDFGLAKRLSDGYVYPGFVGTVGFMAPEVAYCQYSKTCEQASPATDFFSLGVVTYMLVSGGREPFWCGSEVRTIRNTLRREPSFGYTEFDNVSQEAIDFIRGLLAKRPRVRVCGAASLEHPWLADLSREERPQRSAYRLETLRMRKFMARYRWRKAIRAVRTMIKVKNTFAGIPHDL